MEHIIHPAIEGIDFTRYSAYVASISHRLPPHVHAFAADPRHFDLTSPSSLHDAWLEALTVREAANGERHEVRHMEVALDLLGPLHDRRIHLRYTGVTRYTFTAPPRYGEARYEHTAHGDLFTHEIRLGDHDLLIHEFLFERGATSSSSAPTSGIPRKSSPDSHIPTPKDRNSHRAPILKSEI